MWFVCIIQSDGKEVGCVERADGGSHGKAVRSVRVELEFINKKIMMEWKERNNCRGTQYQFRAASWIKILNELLVEFSVGYSIWLFKHYYCIILLLPIILPTILRKIILHCLAVELDVSEMESESVGLNMDFEGRRDAREIPGLRDFVIILGHSYCLKE